MQPEFNFSGYKGIEISRIIYEAKHLKTFAQITVLHIVKTGSRQIAGFLIKLCLHLQITDNECSEQDSG
jgi:hypothetical protein